MKTLITILLTCLICVTGRTQEQFTEPFELLSDKGHGSDFSLTGCMVGISCLAGGAVIVVWLRSFCQKHLGTNGPPSTNMHQVIRSENLTDWKLVGSMKWDDENRSWDYRETNSMAEPFHFYRITNYFGQ